MEFIADFHIHSKYSRATSGKMDLEGLDEWAQAKGIKVVGTGDFTHPEWFESLKKNLEPAEPGLFKLKKSNSSTRFILTVEISNIYSKKGRVRKVHNVIFSPSFEVVEKINNHLAQIGNLKADGRPILGIDSKELLKIILDASENCLFMCAHVMTPWFGIFGSKSGFDSIDECFEEYSKYIYALETGLSADCPMLWRIKDCRERTLLSNSDAHSGAHLGREANVFNTELDYQNIIEAIKNKDPQKFLYTIEFYPEEGKYHYDGHRECNISLYPQETKKYNGICPVCGRQLTIGVLNRVNELADQPEGFVPQNAIPFKSLVPLQEIIAQAVDLGVNSKQVLKEYQKLIKTFESEFKVLLDVSIDDLSKVALPQIAEGIKRVRNKEIQVVPGYDGVYGKANIFSQEERKRNFGQKTLF